MGTSQSMDTDLMFLDTRHFQSPQELLNAVALVTQQLTEHYDSNPPFDQERLIFIQNFAKEYLREPAPDEMELLANLESEDSYEENMLATLAKLTRILMDHIEKNSSSLSFSAGNVTGIENYDGLEELSLCPARISGNQNDFLAEAAQICKEKNKSRTFSAINL